MRRQPAFATAELADGFGPATEPTHSFARRTRDPVNLLKASHRAIGPRKRDRAIESYHGRRAQAEQLVEKGHDHLPIRGFGTRRARVRPRNGGFQMILGENRAGREQIEEPAEDFELGAGAEFECDSPRFGRLPLASLAPWN